MSRKWKQAAAMGLAAAMLVTVTPGSVNAAKKTVKLSASKITVNVGDQKKVDIKNTTGKKVKKITCKLLKGKKNVSVKKTKKCVKIKGLKAGTAKLKVTFKTAGSGSYKYTLSVTVNKPSVKEKGADETAKSTEIADAKNDNTKKDEANNTEETEKKEEVKKEVEKSIWRIPVKKGEEGERELCGNLYLPTSEGKHPAVILSHGYNGSGNDFNVECKEYAKNGYICYSIDFCGGSGRSRSIGLETTEMTIFTEEEDLLAAFEAVAARDDVDTDHIYLFGGSQGGLVTFLAAEELKERVKAVAVYFPALCIPDNWKGSLDDAARFKDNDVYEFWGMKLGRVFAEAVKDYDVFEHLGGYQGQVYIIHGDKDPIARLVDSKKAVEENYKGHAKLTVIEGAGHGFGGKDAIFARDEVLKFMNENK